MTDFLETPQGRRIAYHKTEGQGPTVVFLGGFASDMEGTKAVHLEAWARAQGRAYLRFDYSGHGESSGRFTDGCIGDWATDAAEVIGAMTQGPLVLVGSSMGGWLALLLVRVHLAAVGADKSRIKGVVLIAPAIDMTKDLMWDLFDDEAKQQMAETGIFRRPSEYGDPYEITADLIEDGKQHLFGDALIETGCPVHILQGVKDDAVPWTVAVDLVGRLAQDELKHTAITPTLDA